MKDLSTYSLDLNQLWIQLKSNNHVEEFLDHSLRLQFLHQICYPFFHIHHHHRHQLLVLDQFSLMEHLKRFYSNKSTKEFIDIVIPARLTTSSASIISLRLGFGNRTVEEISLKQKLIHSFIHFN